MRGNVFLNWQGLPDQPYLLLGEDAKPFFEAENVLVENNLFLGNSANKITAAFCRQGSQERDLPGQHGARRLPPGFTYLGVRHAAGAGRKQPPE